MILTVIISMIVIIAVILLSVFTVNKGYSYQHTIDPAPETDEKDSSKNETNMNS